MNIFTTQGTYGSNNTPCEVLVYETYSGAWYCVEGSHNVNFTPDIITEGDTVNVETVYDTDTFTTGEPIDTLSQLQESVED